MHFEDTIAAIATAHGTGGIGIVRISGEKAFEIAAALFRGKKSFQEIKTHTLSYGRIIDPDTGETVDEVLLTKMKKPHTFTREDVVEVNCHGGTVVVRRLLELVVRAGARVAEPGEFTRRAFLNGRIDLSQAEAVIDLIHARTGESSRAAVDQLEGRLSRKLKDITGKLVELIAHIEVTVDYPEHDIEEITGQKVYEALGEILDKLTVLQESFERGRLIREGIHAVIIGRPNVGKSSLLNELTGKSRAIVTDIPGTTRDILEEYVNIRGVPVNLVDTAGIRETEDIVEKIGVERAEQAVENADLAILMVDASQALQEEDFRIFDRVKAKKVLVLANKLDLADQSALQHIRERFAGARVMGTSMTREIGIDMIEQEIAELFFHGRIQQNNEVLVTNVRHKNCIDQAVKSVREARRSYEAGMPLDCITIDIKNAAEQLGEITGESVSEEVMHEIFSRFCLGK